jgi:hypothetical protein
MDPASGSRYTFMDGCSIEEVALRVASTPDAPSQFNDEYTSGNPLGRVFELGIKQRC